MEQEYQIYKRCVMDTTDPDIVFDENCETSIVGASIMVTKNINLNQVKKSLPAK